MGVSKLLKLKPREKKSNSKKSFGAKRKKSSEILAIDIGDRRIKYVVGSLAEEKIKVNKIFYVDTSGSSYDRLQNNELEGLKSDIQKGLMENSMKTKDVVCTIDSKAVISRELIVPAVSEADLEGLISYEVRQYLPIDISSFVLQYKVIKEFAEDGMNKYEVWVAVFPKDIANRIYTLLKDLDLEPLALDISSNAIDKLSFHSKEINRVRNLDKKNIVFVDMGHSYMNVTILEEGIYKFNRIIDAGGADIDKLVREYENEEDFESIKLEFSQRSVLDLVRETENLTPGMPFSLEKSSLEGAIGTQISAWVDEIEKIIKYYTTRAIENKVDKIFIYGGSSLYSDIDKYIEDRLSISTEKITSVENIDMLDKVMEKEIPMYLNAIGSLIRK